MMKLGDKYQHFKGTEYTFRGIALPLNDLSNRMKELLSYKGKVSYHENTYELDLYELDGVLFLNADIPHVIYQSEKDYSTNKYWAREVDDFFGYKEKDGKLMKRFTKTNEII